MTNISWKYIYLSVPLIALMLSNINVIFCARDEKMKSKHTLLLYVHKHYTHEKYTIHVTQSEIVENIHSKKYSSIVSKSLLFICRSLLLFGRKTLLMQSKELICVSFPSQREQSDPLMWTLFALSSKMCRTKGPSLEAPKCLIVFKFGTKKAWNSKQNHLRFKWMQNSGSFRIKWKEAGPWNCALGLFCILIQRPKVVALWTKLLF